MNHLMVVAAGTGGHVMPGLAVAEALRDLGRFLAARRSLDLVAEAEGSAERFASMLAAGMPCVDM